MQQRLAALPLVVGTAGFGVGSLHASRAPAPEAMEPITVAWSPFESTALSRVAEDRGFFGENGLCVTLRRYDTRAASPAESRAIEQKRLDLDPGYMDTVWQQNQFALTLDQSLVSAMEDEARWMIANNLTNATAIPDFGEYVDTAALEKVRPESVRVFN